jgi:hypothetical protein
VPGNWKRSATSDKALRDNAELIGPIERTLAEAFAQDQLRSSDLKRIQIAGRALVYGCARMIIDGAFSGLGRH